MGEKHIIRTEWKGNLSFEADVDGHKVPMDVTAEIPGTSYGPSPKKLLLVALSGCTGMDVVNLLRKMRVDIDSCTLEVQGDVAETDPKRYTRMHVIYTLKGKNIPLDKVQKVVRMSEETYCGVEALFRMAIEITSEIRLIES